MSLSLRFLGVPPDSGLFELLVQLGETKPQAAAGFQFVPSWLGNRPPGPKGGGWRKDDPAVAWCARMIERDPTFVTRHAHLGSWLAILQYVLSPWGRAEATRTDFDDLVEYVFLRGEVLHPELKGTRGVPYKHIPQDKTAELGARLETLDFAGIAANFDPVEMNRLNVYKIHPDTSEAYAAQQLSALEEIYGEFRSFFVEARRRGESVLAFLD